MDFTVDVHTTFDFSSEPYRTLFENSDCSPFCSPLWLGHFYGALCPATGAQPVIVTIRQGERLVALLPLLRRRYLFFSVIEFADLGVSDYSDFPTAPDFSAPSTLGKQILKAIAPFSFISIRKIRRLDVSKFTILGEPFVTRAPFDAHATVLTGPLPEWQKQNFESSFKSFLARKSRLLSRLGNIALKKANTVEETDAAFSVLRVFRASRFDALELPDLLQSQHVFDFYKSIAMNGGKNSTAATYTLLLDDKPIAVIFGLVHRRIFSFLLMAFDFDSYRNYSVGLLAIEQTIGARIAAGDVCFDFMIGEQPYKKDFGTAATEIYSVWRGNGFIWQLAIKIISRSSLLQRAARRLSRN